MLFSESHHSKSVLEIMSYGNKIVKYLFDKAPYPFKVSAASVYGLQQRVKRFDKGFYSMLEMLKLSQYWNEKELREYQDKRIVDFLQTIKDVKYYHNRPEYSELIKNSRPISEFPVLNKKEVKEHHKQFYNTGRGEVVWGHTSGTTGSAMVFPLSLQAYRNEYAFRAMHYNWAGVDFVRRDKIAMCSGHPVALTARKKPPFWTMDLVNNHLYFSSYHMGNATLAAYIEKLESFDPVLLHGYPSSIYLLALAYKKYRRKKLSLKAVFTSSETLLDFQRKAMEDAFQVKVFNWYGNSEMSANIVECECGELHLKSEQSFAEILNGDNKPCNPGEIGRIVSTNFNNVAFPLIRYDVGDMVTISANQKSKCGRSGLLIEHIEGRIEDYIITPDHRIVGRLDHLFKDSVNVLEAQIFQPSVNEIILRIIRSENYNIEDEKGILTEARMRLGEAIGIRFEYVDEIARSNSGKYQFIVSTIEKTPDLFLG